MSLGRLDFATNEWVVFVVDVALPDLQLLYLCLGYAVDKFGFVFKFSCPPLQ